MLLLNVLLVAAILSPTSFLLKVNPLVTTVGITVLCSVLMWYLFVRIAENEMELWELGLGVSFGKTREEISKEHKQ